MLPKSPVISYKKHFKNKNFSKRAWFYSVTRQRYYSYVNWYSHREDRKKQSISFQTFSQHMFPSLPRNGNISRHLALPLSPPPPHPFLIDHSGCSRIFAEAVCIQKFVNVNISPTFLSLKLKLPVLTAAPQAMNKPIKSRITHFRNELKFWNYILRDYLHLYIINITFLIPLMRHLSQYKKQRKWNMLYVEDFCFYENFTKSVVDRNNNNN